MAQQAYWPNNKGLKKDWDDKTFYLGIACDLTNGKGWHAQVHCNHTFDVGYGFDQTNKMTAIRSALSELKSSGYFSRLATVKRVEYLLDKRNTQTR